MSRSHRKRLSTSPEKLILAKRTYDVGSACARTFLILGDAVVWGHCPHLQLIHGLQHMKDLQDARTLRTYGVKIAGTLDEASLARFRKGLTGVLGDNRRRNKAGRIWLRVPDEDGTHISVISFWAARAKIHDDDIARLHKAFQVRTPLWVDFIDRAHSLHKSAL